MRDGRASGRLPQTKQGPRVEEADLQDAVKMSGWRDSWSERFSFQNREEEKRVGGIKEKETQRYGHLSECVLCGA